MGRVKIITRNVWVLSLVSLFNDASSEMLIPIMPIYLKSIGFGILLIGVLEGFAEAFAGLSKGYFGSLSDSTGRRLPFVQMGYAISNVAKTMLVAFANPFWVFFSRAGDKLGKGLRTGARDAILSDEATPETKGAVFGFNKALDTLGAVIGPLVAMAYLYYNPNSYKGLFLLAFIPGLIAVGFTFLVKEKKHPAAPAKQRPRFFDFVRYWQTATPEYRKVVVGLLAFTLVNFSDTFLLLKMKDAGFSDTLVLGIYIFYNLVFALASYPLGRLADALSMRVVMVVGLLLFATVYAGMAYAQSQGVFIALFFLYGLYAAATDGIAKAWITNISAKSQTATAIGTFTAFQSIAALIASSAAGAIWFAFGAPAAFIFSAAVVVLVALYMAQIKADKHA